MKNSQYQKHWIAKIYSVEKGLEERTMEIYFYGILFWYWKLDIFFHSITFGAKNSEQ